MHSFKNQSVIQTRLLYLPEARGKITQYKSGRNDAGKSRKL